MWFNVVLGLEIEECFVCAQKWIWISFCHVNIIFIFTNYYIFFSSDRFTSLLSWIYTQTTSHFSSHSVPVPCFIFTVTTQHLSQSISRHLTECSHLLTPPRSNLVFHISCLPSSLFVCSHVFHERPFSPLCTSFTHPPMHSLFSLLRTYQTVINSSAPLVFFLSVFLSIPLSL